MSVRAAIPIVILSFLLAGCAGPGFGGSSVEQLHLLGTPIAVDLDNKPGADGMGLRLYALGRNRKELVHISSGTLQLLLFDGNVPRERIMSTPPLHVWSYGPDELRQHEQETSVGVSYAFVPMWTDHRPKRNRVTVVARYTNAPRTLLYSAPVSVPLSGK